MDVRKAIFLGLLGCGFAAAGAEVTPAPGEFDADELEDGAKFALAPGEQVVFTAKVYGSVGIEPLFVCSDPEILGLVGEKTVYENPGRMKAGMAGADAGVTHFTFRALKAGAAELEYKSMFRGKLDGRKVFAITVE